MTIVELVTALTAAAAEGLGDREVMVSTGDHIHPIAEVAPDSYTVWLRTPGRLSIQPATCGPLDVTGYRLDVTGYRLDVTGYRLDITNEDQT